MVNIGFAVLGTLRYIFLMRLMSSKFALRKLAFINTALPLLAKSGHFDSIGMANYCAKSGHISMK
jgi:hypothetical protein